MAYTIIRPKNNEEWLYHRQFGIGSSEVATVLNLNPYETPLQLWRRKKGLDAPIEQNMAMRLGHMMEQTVAELFEEETHREVIKSSAGDWLMVDNDRPFLRVSPDRLFWKSSARSKNNKGILECKTTQKQIDPADIPDYWFCQVQYQLGVSGMEQAFIAWLSMGRDFGYAEILFDKQYYEWLADEVEKFWTENIMHGIEPDALRPSDIVLKYPNNEGKTAGANEYAYQSWLKVKELKHKRAEIDFQLKLYEDVVKMAFKDAEELTYNGQRLATWKIAKPKAKFNEKLFREEHPELAEKYMEYYEGTRTFLIK